MPLPSPPREIVARLLLVGLCVIGLTTVIAGADDVSRYRTHVLGDALADVLAQTNARPSDVKTLHERPVPIQTIEWHTPYSGRADTADPVKMITFAFVDGRLYQLTVDYDRTRVGGLTTADLVAGVEAVYGPRAATPAASPVPEGSAPGTIVLGHWADGLATVTLLRGPYEDLRLVVRSVALGAKAAQATTAALAQDSSEAPARRAAARAAEAAALQDERTRNRSAFKP